MTKKEVTPKSRSLESERLEQLESQDFVRLKSDCQKSGSLFEDSLFPSDAKSWYCKGLGTEIHKWRRPPQINPSAQFLSPDLSFPAKLTVTPGKNGNFWFLGALSPLLSCREIFERVVPTGQTFARPHYCGIFHFRLWYYGKWRNVVVDDRLPTLDGSLIIAHDKEAQYFWSSLLEKAYAKLVGCFEALFYSYSCEVIEDFTGGLCETYHLNKYMPDNLFSVIYKSIQHSSLITCWIESKEGHFYERQLANGLWKNHLYAMSAVNSIELEEETSPILLVRLRNTCTNSSHWNGAWGPNSREWLSISNQDKENFGLTIENAGEFWMTFDSFKENFTRMDICNLKSTIANFKWEVSKWEESWEPGISSGGSSTSGHFHTNPQFTIIVSEENCDPADGNCATVLVALMQKNRASKRNTGLYDLKIGFHIYSLNEHEDRVRSQSTNDFFQKNKPLAGTSAYINTRQVFGRFRLKPGKYLLVPSTFEPDIQGSFLLRIYKERNYVVNQK